MGRSPCCDKNGVKKGPWTPEEDIILVSYIQQHGPGNWKAVPSNAGLVRCSKSCRLRWTNYLRPGIKRGGFTEHEEKMIIHLQALLGNRWAAIASYLSQRTDNDIKNYWNTHLKKKLRGGDRAAGQQSEAAAPPSDDGTAENDPSSSSSSSSERMKSRSASKGQWERRLQTDINTARQALCEALSIDKSNPAINTSIYSLNRLAASPAAAPTYASSAENIARLLENWTKKSPSSLASAAESAATASFSNNKGSTASPSEGAISAAIGGPANDGVSGIGGANEGEGAVEAQMPFSALENWLLGDAGSPEDGGDFMGMGSLEATADLF